MRSIFSCLPICCHPPVLRHPCWRWGGMQSLEEKHKLTFWELFSPCWGKNSSSWHLGVSRKANGGVGSSLCHILGGLAHPPIPIQAVIPHWRFRKCWIVPEVSNPKEALLSHSYHLPVSDVIQLEILTSVVEVSECSLVGFRADLTCTHNR